jgi:hypothetical protein
MTFEATYRQQPLLATSATGTCRETAPGRLGKFASISGWRLTGAARASGFGQVRSIDTGVQIVNNYQNSSFDVEANG